MLFAKTISAENGYFDISRPVQTTFSVEVTKLDFCSKKFIEVQLWQYVSEGTVQELSNDFCHGIVSIKVSDIMTHFRRNMAFR